MEKYIWTLTGVANGDRPELSRQLLEELPKAVRSCCHQRAKPT